MKFRYFIIFTLFAVLLLGISSVSAADDSAGNVTSPEEDVDLQAADETPALESPEGEGNTNSGNGSEVPQQENSTSENTTQPASPSKTTVKLVTYSNFVKKGSKYYMYLVDDKGNPVANKKLFIKYNGKTLKKVTDKNGKVSLKIKLSKPYTKIKVTFKGTSKYQAFSKKLKVYIDKSLSISIANSKLLTNGYLRIYFSGSRHAISHKNIKIKIGNKEFSKRTNSEGFVVIKPKVAPKEYTVKVTYKKYKIFKKVKCIEGNVSDPLTTAVPTKNGVPNVDFMPKNYVMADGNAMYTLKKAHYLEAIKRDSYSLFLNGKLSKYTCFKTKLSPNTYHILKREKWNVIERAILTKVVKKNKYKYWPGLITVSLAGKSYTYPEVRDIQNTEVTCGPTSSSVCSQVLKNYFSEKYFQKKMNCVRGVDIPVIKKVLQRNNFKAEFFHSDTLKSAINELKNGAALIAFLKKHYVAVIDVSSDGKKILVSNSYGSYNVGGANKVPTGWVSLKYFKTKFQDVGLVVKTNYKIAKGTQNQINNLYSSMGANWKRQNTKQTIPDIGL